jgi:hypothetical protein
MSAQSAQSSLLGFGCVSPALLPPIGAPSSPAGFAAPAEIQTHASKESADLNALAAKVMADPILLRQLSDRVYHLLLEDLQQQHHRTYSYGGRL